MVKRKRIPGIGLLIIFSLVCLPVLSAQDGEGGRTQGEITGSWTPREGNPEVEPLRLLEVRTETVPASPVINNPWTVIILVSHPRPSEVNIAPPNFPPFLILERVRIETRLIQGERWTRAEFLFTPQRAAAVTLEPFVVTIPGRQVETGKISVRFSAETGTVRRYEPRLRWVTPVPAVRAGDRGELVLELSNWNPLMNPPGAFFRGRAPRNAILEESPPAEAGEGIIRYIISVIPLDSTEVKLEPFSFQAENFTLSVPGVTVSVGPALPAALPAVLPGREPVLSLIPDNESGDVPAVKPSFPPVNSDHVFPLFRREYRKVIAKAGELWDNGRRVEALAEIRRNERDSLSGPLYIPVRKKMENALGLGFTGNERWHPLKISLLSWGILIFLVVFSTSILLVLRPRQRTGPGIGQKKFFWNKINGNIFPWKKNPYKSVTSLPRRGFKSVIVFVLLIGIIVIFLEEGLGNFLVGSLDSSRKTAVLEESPGYRVPDVRGAVNVRFDEGQPVITSDISPDWCYVETIDGRVGWVQRKAVISY